MLNTDTNSALESVKVYSEGEEYRHTLAMCRETRPGRERMRKKVETFHHLIPSLGTEMRASPASAWAFKELERGLAMRHGPLRSQVMRGSHWKSIL